VLRLTLFAIFELWCFVSSVVIKIPPERKGIMGIGRSKTYSLCGSLESQFMIDEWGYPNTGIFICNCHSDQFGDWVSFS
jgi:hypothetical protein